MRAIRLNESLPNSRVYWVLGDQLLRSITSIGANVIEAQASSSRKEFTHYFQIALKSANESKYWLKLLAQTFESQKDTINVIYNEVVEISKILGASIITLKKIQ